MALALLREIPLRWKLPASLRVSNNLMALFLSWEFLNFRENLKAPPVESHLKLMGLKVSKSLEIVLPLWASIIPGIFSNVKVQQV